MRRQRTHLLGIVIGDNFIDRALLAGMQPTWGFGFVHDLTVRSAELSMFDTTIGQVDIHDNKMGLVGRLC